MIDIQHVTKRYGDLEALSDVSFHVQPGEVFGLLGPNGAGKSTLAKILTGLLRPDTGTASIDGVDVAQHPVDARARFGYLPEESVLYDVLTAREHLQLFADLRQVPHDQALPRAQRLLDFFDLSHAADREVSTYSRGMRRKTSIALTLMANPPAILFDEPVGGLDPDGVRLFAELLAELKRRNHAVIVQSHILGLVEKRCDRIGILDRGSLLACGTLDELRAQTNQPDADLEDLFLAITGRTVKDATHLLAPPNPQDE